MLSSKLIALAGTAFFTLGLLSLRAEAPPTPVIAPVAPVKPFKPGEPVKPGAPVAISLADTVTGTLLPERYLGLSFETQLLLPAPDGSHFFRPDNKPLLALFHTLGITSIRIGGNTVDRPGVPFPSKKDVDLFFKFAHKAGVKVIFTLRMHGSEPAKTAAVAKEVYSRHNEDLEAFAIGNEPDVVSSDYAQFLADWKRYADAISASQFAPLARFVGPGTPESQPTWTRDFVRDLIGGQLIAATQHYYPGGNARLVKDPAEARRLMLSRDWVLAYQDFQGSFFAQVQAMGMAIRLEETNSFWNGGREGASNTYTAALWALDYLHWWAAHGAEGLNFHTGDTIAIGDVNAPCLYAVFHNTPLGYSATPLAYGLKAFSFGASDHLVNTMIDANPQDVNLTAYAYRANDGMYVTVINKEYGPTARIADVSFTTAPAFVAQTMRLLTPDGDIARTTGMTLGDGVIKEDGTWTGHWTPSEAADKNGHLVIRVPPASALVIRLSL